MPGCEVGQGGRLLLGLLGGEFSWDLVGLGCGKGLHGFPVQFNFKPGKIHEVKEKPDMRQLTVTAQPGGGYTVAHGVKVKALCIGMGRFNVGWVGLGHRDVLGATPMK